MKLRRGIETRPFGEAVERETERLSGEFEKELADDNYYSFARDHFSYVARGMYADQLERWMACFPREQFLISKTEDFNRDRSRVYGEVLDFLGLAAWEPASFERTNYGGPYLRMESATRDRLKAFFAPHNQRLYALIGRDLGWE
jgi:hypothetical protein